MFKNVWYDKEKSQIHLWHTIKGERMYDIYNWTPYLFLKTDRNTNIKTIYGDNVIKKNFDSYKKYAIFQAGTKKETHENKVYPELQFLAEWYHGIDDEDIDLPELKIFSIDIEYFYETKKFVPPTEAYAPISAISVYDMSKKKLFVFGLHEITRDLDIDYDMEYFNCGNEASLLKIFFAFIEKTRPDVLTGWNINPNAKLKISGFDIPYIIQRAKKVFGEETNIYHKMSPVNRVMTWTNKQGNLAAEITGVSILCYMTAYKWFSFKNPESYSLDFISNLELQTGKVSYDGDLVDLYKNDWDKYIEYNIVDALLVARLEEKLGYIKLIQNLSLLMRCPMKYYYNMSTLVESRMLTYFRRNNLCAPVFKGNSNMSRDDFEGGEVKEPQRGLHHWIISMDIASSYPSAIVTMNMSIETYYGKIINFTEEDIVDCVSKRKFPVFSLHHLYTGEKFKFEDKKLKTFNQALERGLFSIAPNGAVFRTNKEGVIAHEERSLFMKRREVKGNIKKLENKNEIQKFKDMSQAIKIFLNSVYGVTSVIYSRYFNIHISEAITAAARHTIIEGGKYVNEMLNSDDLNDIIEEIKGT